MTLNIIEIKGLFGKFNHRIKLSSDSPITIVYGPNGVGKSTIFSMIDDLWKLRLSALMEVQYDSLRFSLDNQQVISLERSVLENAINRRNLLAKTKALPELIDDKLTLDDLARWYNISIKDLRQLLLKFVPANRAYYFPDVYDGHEALSGGEARGYPLLPYASIIAERLEGKLADKTPSPSMLLEQCLRIARGLLVHRKMLESSKEHRIVAKLELIESKIAEDELRIRSVRYHEVGLGIKDALLAPEFEISLDETEEAPSERELADSSDLCFWTDFALSKGGINSALGIDIDEVEHDRLSSSISVLLVQLKWQSEWLERLSLFIESMGLFLMDKRLSVNASSGVRIEDDTSKELFTVDRLSSGEKNLFVIFYELILGSETYNLVAIDEPEISLHVLWQQALTDRIIEICDKLGIQAVLLTHSPHIINDHSNVAIGLRLDSLGGVSFRGGNDDDEIDDSAHPCEHEDEFTGYDLDEKG